MLASLRHCFVTDAILLQRKHEEYSVGNFLMALIYIKNTKAQFPDQKVLSVSSRNTIYWIKNKQTNKETRKLLFCEQYGE